jgi:hypothetical protein
MAAVRADSARYDVVRRIILAGSVEDVLFSVAWKMTSSRSSAQARSPQRFCFLGFVGKDASPAASSSAIRGEGLRAEVIWRVA